MSERLITVTRAVVAIPYSHRQQQYHVSMQVSNPIYARRHSVAHFDADAGRWTGATEVHSSGRDGHVWVAAGAAVLGALPRYQGAFGKLNLANNLARS